MFEKLCALNRVSFAQRFLSWEEAVVAASQPLINDGAINKEYLDAIIASIKEYGPYIVIAPNIALPHAKGGFGVNETSIAFMKVEEPVHFSDSPEHDARLLFVLASINDDDHIEMLQELVELLSDDAFVDKLLEVKNREELIKLVTGK